MPSNGPHSASRSSRTSGRLLLLRIPSIIGIDGHILSEWERVSLMNSSLEAYLELVLIRLRAARRNVWILGSVLIISLVALFFVGTSRVIPHREAVIIAVLLSAFALGFVASLARMESLRAVRELVEALMIRD